MSRRSNIEYIKRIVQQHNVIQVLDIFAMLFEYSIIIKLMDNKSISITYASDLIHKKYNDELVEIMKMAYPNIKSIGSYKTIGQHSKTFYYNI